MEGIRKRVREKVALKIFINSTPDVTCKLKSVTNIIKLWGFLSEVHKIIAKHSWWGYEENFRWGKVILKYSAAQSTPRENVLRS